MKEFFKKIFENRGLTQDKIDKFYLEFSAIVLLTLVGASKDNLSVAETEQIQKMVSDKKIDDIFNLVHSKYSSLEWEAMIVEHITPVFESFIEEVVLPASAK